MEFRFGYKKVWGECKQYNQTFTLPIDIVNVYHPVRNMLTGTLQNVTFDAGSTGAVASVAAGPTGYITCTSNGHGLLDGEIVYLTNSTDYDGKFVVANKTDNTFDVLETYTQTRACNWYQPSTLKVGANGSGDFLVSYSITGDAAANGKNFKCETSYGGVTALTDLDSAVSERTFGTGSDYSILVGTGIVTLAVGDYIWLQVKNTTDDTDLIIRHGNLNITRIG